MWLQARGAPGDKRRSMAKTSIASQGEEEMRGLPSRKPGESPVITQKELAQSLSWLVPYSLRHGLLPSSTFGSVGYDHTDSDCRILLSTYHLTDGLR